MPIIEITHTPTLIAKSTASDILCSPFKDFSISVIKPDTNSTSLSIRNSNNVSFSISIPVTNVEGSAIETGGKAYRGFPRATVLIIIEI